MQPNIQRGGWVMKGTLQSCTACGKAGSDVVGSVKAYGIEGFEAEAILWCKSWRLKVTGCDVIRCN